MTSYTADFDDIPGTRVFTASRAKAGYELKQAVLDRDYNTMIDLGGQIYFLAKIFATDGLSYLQAVSTMTGMNTDDYQQMMLSGGRSPEGWRSIKDGN